MEQERLQKLIDKVLSGQASPQEEQELDQWYASQDAGQGLTEGLGAQGKNALGSQLFRNIEQRIQTEEVQPAPVYEIPARSNRKWWMAAAVVLLLGAGAFFYFTGKPAEPVLAAVWQEYKTTKDVKELALPDGTRIWLNAGSAIRFDTAFTSGRREIWLQGEAYFDVAQMESAPFVVHTNHITTLVLGTAFNIDAYDSSNNIIVTVKDGKVAVSDSIKILSQLVAGQRIICKADGSFRKDSASADLTAWTSGQLVFRDMKFSEVAKRLERKFGVELIFRDTSIGNCAITASFNETTSLRDILEMLALINGSEIKTGQNPDQYFISGKKQCK